MVAPLSPMPDTTEAAVLLLDARTIDDALLPRYMSWLSPGELARHARFMRPQRQRQFVLGRALLRTVLGQARRVPAAAIVLEERAGQAPLSPAGAPSFSLSHSGHWIACAVSRQTALGLDIEVMDAKRDVLALARQAFGDAVANHLAAMPREQQLASFYRRWSESEARYKLGGEAGEAPSCVTLAHPELSIVLCSATPLAHLPDLQVATLAGRVTAPRFPVPGDRAGAGSARWSRP